MSYIVKQNFPMFISFCNFALQVFINFAKNQSDILPSEEDSTTNVSAPGT